MFGRTQIVAGGLLAIAAMGVGVGTAQVQVTHSTLADSASSASGIGAISPAIRIPRPGQDDGQGGDLQAPHHIRAATPSASGGQAGGSAAGAVPGAAAAPTPGPVSGLLAPVVGALHL